MTTHQKFTEPGDVKIVSVDLYDSNKKNRISLMSQLLTMSVYEDLRAPSIFAEINLNDAINIIQDFPVVGEEFVEIGFQTPGLPHPIIYRLAVVDVKNGEPNSMSTASTYTLRCVSEEQLASSAKMVQVSQRETYGKVVLDIIQKDLESKKGVFVEPTKGMSGIVVPKLKPFAAIDYLRKMAVSNEYLSSGFVFFENQAGFNFRTVEGLIENGMSNINSRVFNYIPDVTVSKEVNANAQRNILKYEIVSRTDTVEKLQTGLLNTVTTGFDVVTKTMRDTLHQLDSDIKSFVTTDSKARSTISQGMYNKYGSQPNDTFFMPFDSSRGLTYRDMSFSSRRAYSEMLEQMVVRIMINGDTSIKVGDVITINIPEIKSTTSRKKDDEFISGNYLVSRLRHIIANDPRPKHLITADVIKVGYTA